MWPSAAVTAKVSLTRRMREKLIWTLPFPGLKAKSQSGYKVVKYKYTATLSIHLERSCPSYKISGVNFLLKIAKRNAMLSAIHSRKWRRMSDSFLFSMDIWRAYVISDPIKRGNRICPCDATGSLIRSSPDDVIAYRNRIQLWFALLSHTYWILMSVILQEKNVLSHALLSHHQWCSYDTSVPWRAEVLGTFHHLMQCFLAFRCRKNVWWKRRKSREERICSISGWVRPTASNSERDLLWASSATSGNENAHLVTFLLINDLV